MRAYVPTFTVDRYACNKPTVNLPANQTILIWNLMTALGLTEILVSSLPKVL